MRAIDIKWDTDGDRETLESLPAELRVPDGVRGDDIDDWLSDETGWCHMGYRLAPDPHIRAETLLENEVPGGMSWTAYRLTNFADALDVWDALFWGHSDGQAAALAEKLKYAAYPCWVLFWTDKDLEGGCAGTVADVRRRLEAAFDRIDASEGHDVTKE